MLEYNDLIQALQPIKNRIFLLFGKGAVQSVDDSEDTQTLKAEVLKDELLEKIERYSNYGFESYPKADAEAIIIFPNGDHSKGVAVVVHDRAYRPKLNEGEAQVYDWNGSVVHLKQDKSILVEAAIGSKIDLKADNSIYIESASGNIFDLKADGTFQLEDKNGNVIKTTATQVDINGNLTVDI